MSITANRVNKLAARFESQKYLEIGVRSGATFFHVDMPLKIAVDPNFQFAPKDHSKAGVLYLDQTSDDFFSTFLNHPQASLFYNAEGKITFDIIYIDGLHTFEQSFRDFENSLRFSHEHTLWILDDVVPSDVFSAIPDQKRCRALRSAAGGVGTSWHGDVFKTLFTIHDFYPDFSYCTIMVKGAPQAVLWRAKALPGREPRFASKEEIESLGYLDMLDNSDLYFPVDEQLMLSLVGKSLVPSSYAQEDTWKKILYAKIRSANEIALSKKLKAAQSQAKKLALQLKKTEKSRALTEASLRQELADLKQRLAAQQQDVANQYAKLEARAKKQASQIQRIQEEHKVKETTLLDTIRKLKEAKKKSQLWTDITVGRYIPDPKNPFPSRGQRYIISCIKPFVKIFAAPEYYIKMCIDPSDTFASTENIFMRFLTLILTSVGPAPQKTKYQYCPVTKSFSAE